MSKKIKTTVIREDGEGNAVIQDGDGKAVAVVVDGKRFNINRSSDDNLK